MAAYHVLVVDDNHEIRRMVTATLKTLGAEIDVLDVPSAEEALYISASLPLDLIVLDFRLPGMSGLEMVSRLRKRKPGIKIILVTGVEDEESRQQVMAAGVAAYFFKPIEIAAFIEAVKRVLWSDENRSVIANEPGAGRPPGAAGMPVDEPTPGVQVAPGAAMPSSEPVKRPISPPRFQPTLAERVNALKQQLRATSVLLVDDAGQVVEIAGSSSYLTPGNALLPALADTIRASRRAAETISGSTESLLCYTSARQHLYLAAVDPSHALLAVTEGYFEPDRLGLIDRAIQLAAQDLRVILEAQMELESRSNPGADSPQAELPAEIVVDHETLAGVAKLFSHAPKKGGQEQADGFWEALEENGVLDGRGGKNVISYDEARKMGLAPGEDKQP